MKEIIYVQAGTYANHIGTHFWNTQESYLNALSQTSPPEASDISEIDPQVAFRRSEQQVGISTCNTIYGCVIDDVPRGQTETLTPRAVVFDHKGTSEPTLSEFSYQALMTLDA